MKVYVKLPEHNLMDVTGWSTNTAATALDCIRKQLEIAKVIWPELECWHLSDDEIENVNVEITKLEAEHKHLNDLLDRTDQPKE